MDINILIQNPAALLFLAVIAYVIVSFGLYFLVEHFYGWQIADRFVGNSFLLPYRLVAWFLMRVYRVFSHPWRFRQERLFKEIFYFRPPTSSGKRYETQEEVDSVLTSRARTFQNAIDEERKADGTYGISNAKNYTKWAKKIFWEAHSVAKAAGYTVRESFRDYLK